MMEGAAFPTLDGLFRRTLARRPDAVALIDPQDKPRVTGDAPRRLTYAQADTIISALAAHFIEARLPAGSVIALQLPNTVEFYLTILAASRAGLVAALLPQLWRQADLAAALSGVSARAIVTCGAIDGVNHADLAMNAAVEAFSIRHVCGFGHDLPDGMVSLDEAIANPPSDWVCHAYDDARKPAIITFDVTIEGLRAVPRTHLNVIAGGLAVFLESRLPSDAILMSAAMPSSFGPLAASLVTWLLTGGTLALHHPFAPDILQQQIASESCDALIAPTHTLFRLAESDLRERCPTLRHLIGLWRAPEQAAFSQTWRTPTLSLTDVHVFGEVGILCGRRDHTGSHVPLAQGLDHADPLDDTTTDATLTAHGTLALHGPMVPVMAYQTDLALAEATDGVDTGYAARPAADGNGLCVTAPPAGIIGVGGYRFLADELEAWARRLPQDTTLTALPDQVAGQRLAGHAANRERTYAALIELGLNPLIAEAFRSRAETTSA